MVDALEALIAWAARDQDLATLLAAAPGRPQVAAKHRFGDGWEIPSSALTLRYDGGGLADLYTQRQVPRIEARCYGASQAQAAGVYAALQVLARRTERARVQTAQGLALIYWWNMVSTPSLLVDPDSKIDYVLAFMEAAVAEVAVA